MTTDARALTRQPAVVKTRRSRRRLLPKVFFSLLLIAGSVVFIMPFVWMLSTSLKQSGGVFMYPPQWIPEPIVGELRHCHARHELPVLLKNTVLVTSLSMVGAMATSALAAYSFARLRFPARDFIFIVVLATMMLPAG